MNETRGALHFEITGSNDDLKRKLAEIRQGLLDSGKTAEAEGAKINRMFKSAAFSAAAFFSVATIKQFGTELINIRGQFQTFEAVLTNTLQSPAKAKGAMDMLQNFAATTPFQVDALTSAFVKLANQGFVPTYTEMEKMGDLASSTGKGFDQLAEAVIDAQTGEFERLKEFGIRANKEGDKVTFTFKEQATQVDFTASSIRNYILSLGELKGVQGANAEIAKTLTGQMSNLQDGITQMMNEIGQSSEGILSGALSGASYLVEHYEEVGRILGVLITTYGAYKAAIIATIAYQKALAVIETVKGFNQLTITLRRTTQAQILLNLAMGANPILKIISLLIAVGTALYMFGSKTKDATNAIDEFNKKQEEQRQQSENLIRIIQDVNETEYAKITAYEKLAAIMPSIAKLYDIEAIKLLKTADAQKEFNKARDAAEYKNITDNILNATEKVKQYNEFINAASSEKEKIPRLLVSLQKDKLRESQEELQGYEKQLEDYISRVNQANYTKLEPNVKLERAKAKLEEITEAFNKVKQKLEEEEKRFSEGQIFTVDLTVKLNYKYLKDEKEGIEKVVAGIENPVKKNTYKEDYDTAAKEWKESRIALKQIEVQKNKFTSEQYENAKKRFDKSEKDFKDLGGITNSKPTPPKTTFKDYTSELVRQSQEKMRLEASLANEAEQARIDLMDEGLAKVLAQNKLNFDKEIAQIEQQKNDKLTKIQEWERTIWESQNPNWEKEGKTFTPATKQLPAAQQDQFEVIESSASATFEAKNKQAYEIALNDYATFARAYIDKVNEFEQDIKNLNDRHQESRNNLVTSGASKEAIDQFDQKAKKEVEIVNGVHQELLTGLDEQMEMKNQAFLVFAEQIANMGIEELKLKLDEAEQLLADAAAVAGDKGDQSSVVQYQAQIKALKQQIVALSKKDDDKDKKEAGDPLKKHKATLKAVKEIGGMAKDISDAFQGLDGDIFEVMDSIGSMSSSIGTLMESLILMAVTSQGTIAGTTIAANTGVVATSTAASLGIQSVEKASVILAIIGAALQIVTAIAKTVSGLFNNDGKKDAEIQRLQGQVDALEVSYEKLGKAIDKAYSANAATLIEKQDANLKQQKKLLEEQIHLEEEKKDTDNGKVDQYRDAIKKIDDELEQTRDKTIEAIIGEDVKSAIEQFAEAYTDAWAAGEDKAASMKDVVRKMVRSAINELVKSRLSPEVDAFMGYLAKAMEDGILTIAEQKTLDSLENSIYNKLNGLDSSLDKYVTEKEEDRTASSKGFAASITQDSANELNGRFTAMQGMLFDVKEAQAQMLAVQKLNLPLLQNLTHLTDISENTAYCKRLEGIEKDMNTMKNDISTIATRGITIRK